MKTFQRNFIQFIFLYVGMSALLGIFIGFEVLKSCRIKIRVCALVGLIVPGALVYIVCGIIGVGRSTLSDSTAARHINQAANAAPSVRRSSLSRDSPTFAYCIHYSGQIGHPVGAFVY